MTGLDKIKEDIQAESLEAVARIQKEADEKQAKIREDAENALKAAVAKVEEDGEKAVQDRSARAKSAADLLRRKKLLAAKQDMIAETIVMAQESIKNLPADQYFDLLVKLAGKNALKQDGEVILSQKDLDRMPADFESRLSAASGAKLTVAKKTAPISGGFILNYNGIEENCSLEAIFAEKKEELQDKVRAILFA
ncbi:MAG: V-type ATP synthase subunit E [Lachnospiraceae bacterium]|nr:V-type ATP synthase subunit E [Lachnospiraceae bacterium]